MASSKKVIFVMGATGTGKSKLAIGLAKAFQGEIINSDKIQVYKGLDVLTNKVTEAECQGVPHHLLGIVNNPSVDFTTVDFIRHVASSTAKIHDRGHVAIIAGGSNTYIEALVEDKTLNFTSVHDCCFIWVDVSLPTLFGYVAKRVDEMVVSGAVDEVRGLYAPGIDTTRGLYRSIGVPEIGKFLEAENGPLSDLEKEEMLRRAIEETKENTCGLVRRQVEKIKKLKEARGWEIRRVDSTKVFEHHGEECCGAYWEELVLKPCLEIVGEFLNKGDEEDEDEEEKFLEASSSSNMEFGKYMSNPTTEVV